MMLLYPWVLVLIPAYLLCQYLCPVEYKQKYFSNTPMLLLAYTKSIDYAKWIRFFVVSMMLVALSNPVLKRSISSMPHSGYDVALLLDASDSMHESKRFEHAKSIIEKFVKSRPNDRIALELFADHPYLSIAMTYEKQSFDKVLPYLQIGIAGKRYTALNEALFLAATLFDKSHKRAKFIILLTDGLNTVKSVPLKVTIAKLKKEHIKVFTIGIGDDYRKEILRRIATSTDGKFYAASNPKALDSIYQNIGYIQKEKFKSNTQIYQIPLFRYPLWAAVFGLILLLWFDRSHYKIIIASLVFTLIALTEPAISKNQNHTVEKKPISLLIGVDLSDSMKCADNYPSRLRLAINKASKLIDMLPGAQIGILGFAKQPYLIAAPTHDHKTLHKALSMIDISHIDTKGSNIISLIRASKDFKMQDNQALVIFTDGGELKSFANHIKYAKKNHLNISVYLLGTAKGGVIPDRKSIREDLSGNIIITKSNPAIKIVSTKTQGIFTINSSSNDAIEKIADHIKNISKKENIYRKKYQNKIQLYWLFVIPSLLFLLWGNFAFRRKV